MLLPAPNEPGSRRVRLAALALALAMAGAACSDDQSGSTEDPDGLTNTGEQPETDGTAPSANDDPDLPGDTPRSS